METQNSNQLFEKNLFENVEPEKLKFFMVLSFLPFSKYLALHLMKNSSKLNSLDECKEKIKKYAIVTLIISLVVIGFMIVATSPPDSLTPRFKKSIEINTDYGDNPLPRINTSIQKVIIEDPSIVSVDKEDGRIEGKKAGVTNVTYIIDGKKLTTKVNVAKGEKKHKKKKKGKK